MSIKTILKNLIERSEFTPRLNHAGRFARVDLASGLALGRWSAMTPGSVLQRITNSLTLAIPSIEAVRQQKLRCETRRKQGDSPRFFYG
jgi:hypothetical protein